MTKPKLLVLCPTYGREPSVIENSIQCFLTQTYKDSYLLIYDDLGNYPTIQHPRYRIVSSSSREPSLPAKYNSMLELANKENIEYDAVCVWDDDDVYLFRYLEWTACIFNLGFKISKPSKVLSTYSGFEEELGKGRFHGSLSIHKSIVESLGGWIQTDDKLFDQFMINESITAAGGDNRVGDPCMFGPPQYVFRWNDSGASHTQHVMSEENSKTWYQHVKKDFTNPVEDLSPKWDESAIRIWHTFSRNYGSQMRGS